MSYQILQGDCRASLATMATGSVQVCATSPPYFGLRDYQAEGQLGLEQTPAEYVAALVSVFAEVWRVLADDGTLWLNLGDSYATGGRGGGGAFMDERADGAWKGRSAVTGWRNAPPGLKHKDLVGIPWRVAFALQEAGWHLRQDIIWAKPNPMPESVTDRCTKAHEYLFLLTKQPRYYFDSQAMQEPTVGGLPGNRAHKHTAAYEAGDDSARTKSGLVGYAERQRSKRDSFKRDDSKRAQVIPGQSVGTHRPDREESTYDTSTRNRRSVWTVATQPYAGAHFATFPPELIRPCILAGSRPGDVVLDCFNGSGTTGQVALEEGRRYVGCELNPDYITLTHKRLSKVQTRLQFGEEVRRAA